MKLTRYEIKKMFSQTSCKVALVILAITIAVVCYFACDVSFVNDQGETITGDEAISELRNMQKEWAGILDEETIARVIALNHQITSSPEYNSQDIREQEIAYSKGQGIIEIRRLLNSSYSEEFRSFDYYLANSLSENDAPRFYSNRLNLLKEWFDSEANVMFSEKDKEYIIEKYKQLKTPFYYDYVKGWSQLFEYSMSIIMIMMLVLGFITSSIFSNEFTWKADSIFFTTVKGRNHAIAAKLKAGFIIVTGIYIIVMVIYTIIVLMYLGTDGMNCQIQIIHWKSMYNAKIWQEYLFIIIGGYLGCLFMSVFCMLVSAKTKSSVVAVIIPFVVLFLPSFVGNIDSAVVNKILGLLPDQLLQVNLVFVYFNLYQIGGRVFSALSILFVVYSILTLALFPGIYVVYKKK
ncbi:MAG: ABC transporter permease [Lachnospiraceae bacterium]|nr:ABC transporter permease [Lachnospiraceae bacterium]